MSGQDKRALLFGATSLVAALSVSHGLPGWRVWHQEVQAAAAEAEREVMLAEWGLRFKGSLEDTLGARVERVVNLAPGLVAGRSSSAAAAALAALISGTGAKARVEIASLQVDTDSVTRAVFTRLRVRASGHGDIGGIASLLRELETGPTVLWIREIAISQPNVTSPPNMPERLRFEFVVEALSLITATEEMP